MGTCADIGRALASSEYVAYSLTQEAHMPAPITWSPSAAEALKRLVGRLFATTTETAAILNHDPRTIRKAIDAGEIPSVRVGATRRVPVAWIREQARIGTDGGPTAA
jgi:excisionase family DNA binding protein